MQQEFDSRDEVLPIGVSQTDSAHRVCPKRRGSSAVPTLRLPIVPHKGVVPERGLLLPGDTIKKAKIERNFNQYALFERLRTRRHRGHRDLPARCGAMKIPFIWAITHG